MKKIKNISLLILLANLSFLYGQPLTIDKDQYRDKLEGFWLGSCIANWTGLKTEGLRKDKPYFTDEDWNTNQGNEWHGAYIDFVLDKEIWGADDDTDIEYIYQHAMETYDTYQLTGEQIREQWLQHISPEEENYLWVSNETAFNLMREEMITPPLTSLPFFNENWEMIDAQLTTEIFGLLAPTNPDLALELSYLPIRTTAYSHSMYAAQFYVIMHALASSVDSEMSRRDQVLWLADSARTYIPESSYIARMYDWVRKEYMNSTDKDDWESVRDAFHDYYIEGGADDYTYTEFYDCGSNFGFSIVSLLFGEGDFKRTVQIGTLSGQDSDNPTATWGGLLGFMYGFDGLAAHFDKNDFSEKYDIHRTRINFDEGLDSFSAMADRLLPLIEKVLIEQMNGMATEESWTIGSVTASNYYLSSINGEPNGDGSKDNPWASLENIDGFMFSPGDSVLFERGSKWTGTFEITASGSLNSPIVFTSYGEGDKPALSNPDGSVNDGNAIRISASHILIDDLYIHDCGLSGPRTVGGIASFNPEDHHITIQNSEFSGCRVAVRLYAHDVLITNNYMYSPGGGINEWWGPMAIVVAGYAGEISYNTIEGFLAPNNYGFDGGAIEIDDEGIHTNWKIHHNISRGNEGFLETYDDSECDDCTWGDIEVAYNYSDDYQWFIDGPIGKNVVIENNTILRVLPANTDFNWCISLHHTIPEGAVRNNIFVLSNKVTAFEWENPGDATSNNIYYSVDNSLDNPKGYPLGDGEIIADPLFVNYADRDLQLLEGSPAIDMGKTSRYSTDLNNNPVPQGNAADAGAFESPFSAIVPHFDIITDNLSVEVDGSGSLAENQQSVQQYAWDFGDGNTAKGKTVSHTYSEAGTYQITLTITSTSGKSGSISKSVSFSKPPELVENRWRSFDVEIQEGTPQAIVSDGTTTVNIQFYESANDDGVDLDELLTPYNMGNHPDGFNHLENFWGSDYPYAGKSTVPQGSDTDERKERFPGVYDLQVHPPNNKHQIVCSFEVPFDGNYTISGVGIRRVYNENTSVELRLYNPKKELISDITGTSKTWNYDYHTHSLKNLEKGDFIYFAVANVDGFAYDAAEILWEVSYIGPANGNAASVRKQNIRVYPNPSDGIIHLTVSPESFKQINNTFQIKDIKGQLLDTFCIDRQTFTLDITDYPAGIYFLYHDAIIKKFIKS